jgi:hypothetical protein
MSFFLSVKFFTDFWFTKYTNVATKLDWKLFTNVIKRPSKEGAVLDRECLNKKRSASALTFITDRVFKEWKRKHFILGIKVKSVP